jgi:hypothetical protein
MTMLLGLIVRRTIQLDDHPRGNADKIGDITAYWHLTPEFRADPAITQAAPQDRFRNRQFAAQAPRLGKPTIGNAADHGRIIGGSPESCKHPHPARLCRATFSRMREKVCHAYRTRTRKTGTAIAPEPTSFSRRLGLDCQGVHARIEFSPQEMIDRAMALDQALAPKGLRNYFDVKVGSASGRGRAGSVHDMSVARVLMGFVDDFDGVGGKGGL